MGGAEEAPEAVHPNQVPPNSLPLPTTFDGTNKLNQADLWPKWLPCFERDRITSGLQNKTEQEQIGTLLYATRECRRYCHNIARKRVNRFVHRRQSSTQRLFRSTTQHHIRTSMPQHTIANTWGIRRYLYSRSLPHRRRLRIQYTQRPTHSWQNCCRSPRRHTIRSLVSKIRPHTRRRCSHELPSRSKKTEPYSRSKRRQT